MARKLKSDRVLFTATILLVGLSIVMVYSASAVVALERTGRPSLFLTKQIMWAVLGVAVLGLVMRIDYRTYREPPFIWSSLALVTLGLAFVRDGGWKIVLGVVLMAVSGLVLIH